MKRSFLAAVAIMLAGLSFASQGIQKYTSSAEDVGVCATSFSIGDELNIKLPDGASFTLKLVSAPPAGIAGQSYIARALDGFASAIVKPTKTGWRITIDDFTNKILYTLRNKSGTVSITIDDTSDQTEDQCGICNGEATTPATSETITPSSAKLLTTRSSGLLTTAANDDAFEIASHKSVVDILVAFDQGAKDWVESGKSKESEEGDTIGDTILDFADYAVNKMNTVLQNSNLLDTFCYRLVGVTEIDDTWSQINQDLLGSLRTRAGALSKISRLREEYGADTVTLLINRTSGNTSGIGYEYNGSYKTPSQFDGMNYPCNVCDINTVHSRYTMSHETGHNMGCGHSNRQGNKNSGPGRYPYSCGYHFTDANNARRYTIMAYSYTGDDNYTYDPVPYFSTPDISPADYGRALGVEGVNDNRKTLLNTHSDVASFREHVFPYDWDVHFLDSSGNEMIGEYFYTSYVYVTLSSENKNAVIYYTTDGTTPNKNSTQCANGNSIRIAANDGETTTISACAVIDGVAQSYNTIKLTSALAWSGEQGGNGNGVWIANDSSVKNWQNNALYFFDTYDAVAFPDIAEADEATVTVRGTVCPLIAFFPAIYTAYAFDKEDASSLLSYPAKPFDLAGDLTFNLPVNIDATTLSVASKSTVSFNAPFGTNVIAGATYGHCTNAITIAATGKLIVSPGENNTQVFNKFNTSSSDSEATLCLGKGRIVFNGPFDAGKGVFGDTKVIVGEGANVVFNCAAATGYDITSAFTVENGGVVSFNGDMEHMKRPLYLAGGTINAASRFDRLEGTTITVTDDSFINGGTSGYMLIRKANEIINVSQDKTLTLNIITKDGANTDGFGLVKKGLGSIIANKELAHSGPTIISNGTFSVNYSSSKAYGSGWSVARNATLEIGDSCALAVPSLSLAKGANIILPASQTAPLTVNSDLNLSGVFISLEGPENLSNGTSYKLVKSTGTISGAVNIDKSDMPTLSSGLGWQFTVANSELVASIVEVSGCEPEFKAASNISALKTVIPGDTPLSSTGSLEIVADPIIAYGLESTYNITNMLAITLKVEIPSTLPQDSSSICSWKTGTHLIRCVRNSEGKLDFIYDTTTKSTDFALSSGGHTMHIVYSTDKSKKLDGGTFLYVDGELAFGDTGLKYTNDTIEEITAGADSNGKYPYPGLVVKGMAVLDVLSTSPLKNMTSSNESIIYRYCATNTATAFPSAYGFVPAGGFMMDESLLTAEFEEKYTSASISVVAAFPEDANGAILGLWFSMSDSSKVACQAESDNGSFIIRYNDDSVNSNAATILADPDTSVATPHLYTLTYKQGYGITLYQDGIAILYAPNPYSSTHTSAQIMSPITFGCGPYHYWRGSSWHDYPLPMPDFKVYASHIELGTDSMSASADAVMESLNFDTAYDSLSIAEKLEYLPDYQTSTGVVAPSSAAVSRLPAIDVLVAYDKGAQDYVANAGKSLEVFAAEQIEKMNAVLQTNKLDSAYTYRLAGVCKVDEAYTDINSAVSLIQAGEGACASLRAAREMFGADTVTLLVNTSGSTLGHSSQPDYRGDMASYHDECFSVCSIIAVDTGSQHTMIHENAHNLGCGHGRNSYTPADLAADPDKYSYGYYFKDGDITRHTIMAYGSDNGASWYFSTSSSESGFVLGDETNDNARVIRETCGIVANWRDSVIPYTDDVVATIDGSDTEVFSGHIFSNSLTIALSAPTVDASAILYTTDGSEPTRSSSVYSSALTFTDDTTLKVALLDGITVMPSRTLKLFRRDTIPADGIWQTSLKYPWTLDEDGSLRSCNCTDYSCQATTPLKGAITGPKTLSFSHKSYFGGKTLAGENYSHFDVLLDDSPVYSQTEPTNSTWSTSSIEIPSGSHEVTFSFSRRYAMNNPSDYKDASGPEDDDAVWLKDITLEDVVITTLDIPAGTTYALSDIPSTVKTITGSGTLDCGASLPANLGLTDSAWQGTVAFSGFSDTSDLNNFNFASYGNAKSKIKLTNCTIPYFVKQDVTFAGTLILEGDRALSTSNGYSGFYTKIDTLEGTGSMSFTGSPQQALVFNIATNFSGSITVDAAQDTGATGSPMRGRRIVFGDVTSENELPPRGTQSATITVMENAIASIGADAAWNAYHGIRVAGTLAVMGANSTFKCDTVASMGLTLDDGATLRFDASGAKLTFDKPLIFTNGTVQIEYPDTVTPAEGNIASWPEASNIQGAFKLVGNATNDYYIATNYTSLALSKKPSDRLDITGYSYICEDDVRQWLTDNLDFYESFYKGTWQELLQNKTGYYNKYTYLQNFLLGYGPEGYNQTFTASIDFDDNGNIVITSTEGTVPNINGLVKRLYKKAQLDDEWEITTIPFSSDKSATIEKDSGYRFYKVEITFEE